MKKAFNLKKYIKTAFYEDARGHMQGQTRAWMNCYKQKVDASNGLEPQKAWNSCLEDFQKTADKGKWILNYSSDKETGKKPYFDAKTPAAKKIIK